MRDVPFSRSVMLLQIQSKGTSRGGNFQHRQNGNRQRKPGLREEHQQKIERRSQIICDQGWNAHAHSRIPGPGKASFSQQHPPVLRHELYVL